jgi:hypothetical protein
MVRQQRADNRRSSMKFTSAKIAIAGVVLAVALTGCVVTARPVVPAVGVGIVYSAPPPPPAEVVVGVAPSPGFFWVGGNYGWEGGRYVWHGGRWMAPRPGYRWVPHHWVEGGGGWHPEPGHWVRA